MQLTKPAQIYWCDGTEEEAHRIVEIGMNQEKVEGQPVFHPLNNKTYPHSYLHRSHPTDVARTEHLTYICLPDHDAAGPNNNWKVGVLRRDPMAMLPFCGYNMADYFGHWLQMEWKMNPPVKIFFINWFRTDESGKFLWPGFGENTRILKWIIERANRSTREGARETPIGWVPERGSLDFSGMKISKEKFKRLFNVDREEWKAELEEGQTFLAQFGSRMPQRIWDEFHQLKTALEESR